MIPFNKPYLSGNELEYIRDALLRGKISGDGYYSLKCHETFEQLYGFRKCLLTTSCTDALEMAAILCNIQPGDEVIIPSYTFVSTANAFVLRGAKILFVDSRSDHPGMDENKIEELITPNTKVIVPVHYSGVSCDMTKIMSLAEKYNLFVVEDAAQAIDSYYISPITHKKQVLGSIGHLACFSFHETKNIQCGEGGMLVINDPQFIERAEIIREKGTNRSSFYRGEIDKYGWIDIGSSFLPTDIIAAFLFAQLENLDKIQKKRIFIWDQYFQRLNFLSEELFLKLPYIPQHATKNGHLFYVLCKNALTREKLISKLKKNGIMAVFHYQSLHKSSFYLKKNVYKRLPYAEDYSECLLRLPFYYELDDSDLDLIINTIIDFCT